MTNPLPRPYYGGLHAVHQTPHLFRPGSNPREVVHQCAGAGCATCLWSSWGIVRSWKGFWFGWTTAGESVVIDSDKAAVQVLPEEVNLI